MIENLLEKIISFIKKHFKYVIAAVVAIIIVVSLIVSNFGGGDEDMIADEVQYETVQSISLYMNYVETLNPVSSEDKDTYYISRLIYDGLFSQDENMTAERNLARSYKFDRSRKCIEINLVNTDWHDGEDFVAADVVFSINAHKAAGGDSHYAGAMEKIAYASADGDHRVTIYFNDDDDMSLNALTFPILPSHRYYGVTELLSKSENFKPVGTGPYEFKKHNYRSSIELAPNEEYHGEVPQNDIVCVMQPKSGDPYSHVETSTVSFYVSDEPDREQRLERKNMRIKDFPSNEVEFIGFNLEKEYLQNVHVRRGIARAINCKRIINNCYDGSGMTNDNIYYPNYLEVNSKGDAFGFNRNKSINQLRSGGYEDDDNDGAVENIDGDELNLTLLVDGSNDERVNAAEIIETNLETVGINVTISVSAGTKSYLSALKKNSWDIYLGGYALDENIDMSSLITSDGEDNYTGFENSRVDNLVDEMGSGLEPREAAVTFEKLKEKLTEELPYYCIMYKTLGGIKAPAMRGKIHSNFTDYYRGCSRWYCRYEVSQEEEEN